MKKFYLTAVAFVLTLATFAQTIRIGGDDTPPTSGSQFRSPYSAVYDYSFVQTIYLQSEIQTAGKIQSIAYNFFGPSLANSNQLEIYMKEVTYSQFGDTYTDWEPVAGMTKVFDGTFTPGTLPGWVEITLQTPFDYANTGNLLICIFEKKAGSDYDENISSGNAFGVTDVATKRVIYFVDDGTAPDPSNPPEADNYRTRIGNIQLKFQSVAPVTFSSFEAYAQQNHNKVTWSTSTEQNSKGFEVQSSADGQNFKVIGFVNSKRSEGAISGDSQYEFTDHHPFSGITYYRLSQIDADGKRELTRIISVKNIVSATMHIQMLYPNPVRNTLFMNVSANTASAARLVVTNLEGKIEARKSVRLISGENKLEMDLQRLVKGVYFLRVEISDSPGTIFTKRFLKE